MTLTGKYEKILDHFLEIRITEELVIPTGLFLTVALACLLVWLFMRSKTGIMMKTAGSNPVLAQANGIHVDQMRILGMTLSSVLGAVGIIIYSQSYGFYQFYMAPLNMAFIAVAANTLEYIQCGAGNRAVPVHHDLYPSHCQCDYAGGNFVGDRADHYSERHYSVCPYESR